RHTRFSRDWSSDVCSSDLALRVMSTLGLLDDRDRLISELPFGTRRRVDMARALAGDPRTLLLDEPFSGLGDRERPLMSQIIHERSEERRVGKECSTRGQPA